MNTPNEVKKLAHANHLWIMLKSKSDAGETYTREQLRELIKLAARVVTLDYGAQEEAMNELEEFLR